MNKQEQEKRPLNIIFADNNTDNLIVKFLKERYDVKVINLGNINEHVHLVVFSGGEDVNPDLYGERVGKYTGVNLRRDELEEQTFRKFVGLVPMLGICRGSQFLTVMNGGELIQHVTGHGGEHPITTNHGRNYKMTSTHHQMMFPFKMKEKHYELIAHSTYFKSNTYLDGNNEEKKLPSEFLESEIVFYPKAHSLCIQGHPEYAHCDSSTRKYCLDLIDQYLLSGEKVEPFLDEKFDVIEEEIDMNYKKPFSQNKSNSLGIAEQFAKMVGNVDDESGYMLSNKDGLKNSHKLNG